jgi:hypothetical protein
LTHILRSFRGTHRSVFAVGAASAAPQTHFEEIQDASQNSIEVLEHGIRNGRTGRVHDRHTSSSTGNRKL